MQETSALLIAALRRRMKQMVGAQVREHELSATQFWVLNWVFEHEGLSLRELADGLYMDPPTASRVVAALVRHKLLRMEQDPDDRRRSRIVTSARGRALAHKLHTVALETRAAVDAGLSAAERELLRSLLRKALAHLSAL